MTRAVGQTMDRLAEWEVATLASLLDKTKGDSLASAKRRSGWSRASDRTSRRCSPTSGDGTSSRPSRGWRASRAPPTSSWPRRPSGFADLVSFSELTNRLDDDEIGDLVEVFESRSHDVVSRRAGRVVKTLGDSVLFMAPTPEEGVEIAWDIVQVIGGDQRLPDVRVGLVTGSVVLRMGDVYGPAVNLAARLVGVARRNRVITDAHTAERLPVHRYETRVLPARPVRGFGDLEPVAVRRSSR